MQRYDWAKLNHLQVGRYAEYLAKMEFALFGFDIYTSEVDNKGIDFVVRSPGQVFHEMQVKSLRWPRGDYAYMPKSSFVPKPTLHLVFVVLRQLEAPMVYLIPSTTWLGPDRPGCFVDRDFGPELKSKPEYGLNLSLNAFTVLEQFTLEQQVHNLA